MKTGTMPKTRRKRVKSPEDARDLLYRHVSEAVAVLSDIMQNENMKPELRMKAAESVLDRVCVKPTAGGIPGGDLVGAVQFEGVLEEWSR